MDRKRSCEGASRAERNKARGARRGKAFRRANDWPFDRYAVVERAWPGSTVVCIAGGHSTSAEIDAVAAWRDGQQRRVIAVNDAYRLAPSADVLYFADSRWWGWHYQRDEFRALQSELVTIDGTDGCIDTAPEAKLARAQAIGAGRLWLMHNLGRDGIAFSTKRNGLASGMNSGYQAINLAYLLGAVRVVLLGYSLQPLADGRHHWFGDHPHKTAVGIFSACLNEYRRLAKALPPGFEVINATSHTALDCFPKRSLESLLSDQDAAVLPA